MMKLNCLIAGLTFAMARIYTGVEIGAIDKRKSTVKQARTGDKECLMKRFTGCRIGPALCGVRIDYHNCEFVRAATEACRDGKKEVSQCYFLAFEKDEVIQSIRYASSNVADGF
jgi:hypothetical protein